MADITFATAFAATIEYFTPDTALEYDVDALAAQIEYLVNTEGLLLDTMTPVEFWTIAEPYRW